MIQIAFDIGGTFTDFVLRDSRSGEVKIWKVPTSKSPEKAVVESLSGLVADGELAPANVGSLMHATTVATNAILERKGSRVALVTTKGFRDIILIGRQKRYDTNDMHMDKLEPLVRRADVFELDERLSADGTVVRAIDDGEARELADTLAQRGYEAVAIAFLHAYINPAHEQHFARILRERIDNVPLSISSSISPKFREYERTSTAVANAYVAPLVDAYLGSLGDSLGQLGINIPMSIMQSNGGLVTSPVAREVPIRIVESGPAAGVLMCAAVGREEGISDIITFDMGGTTAKLGAIDQGVPAVTPTFEVDAVNFKKGSGLPLNITAIELLEIGAGGGSLARTKMGLISVGPDSAAAQPGPICYGRGGTQVTVTDANLVLGYLNSDYFNGGAMHLSGGASEAIARDIGEPLGLSVEEAAWGIHSIANANMERAMRVVSIEKGRDPRNYTMIAFGGAGPLHAARLARSMEIPRVVIPRGAGVGSALGLIVAQPKIDVALTRVVTLDGTGGETISEVYAELEKRAMQQAREVDPNGKVSLSRSASVHYVGQGYELRVELPSDLAAADFDGAIKDAFYATYKREYGYVDTDAAVEVTDWYVIATISDEGASHTMRLEGGDRGRGQAAAERMAYFPEAGGMIPTKVIDRYALEPGERLVGPALVEERESTTVVLPGDVVFISDAGNLVIEIGK
ncbi:MAG: hydantoinase/oxoprolinase family protein [Variibacter sp.]